MVTSPRCPHCGSILLFPDLEDRTTRDRSRERICAFCGWVQHLDTDGAVYQPAPYTPEDDSYGAASTGGRPWGSSARVKHSLDQRMVGHTRYDGCQEVSPSCLECPLPACKSDNPQAFKAWKEAKALREWFPGRPVVELSYADIPAEVARTGLDPRTVYRRLALLKLKGRPDAM